jgi:hypothetical protein
VILETRAVSRQGSIRDEGSPRAAATAAATALAAGALPAGVAARCRPTWTRADGGPARTARTA